MGIRKKPSPLLAEAGLDGLSESGGLAVRQSAEDNSWEVGLIDRIFRHLGKNGLPGADGRFWFVFLCRANVWTRELRAAF
jgi:hypothetical protein